MHPEGKLALDTGFSQSSPVTPSTHVFSKASWKAAHPDESDDELNDTASQAAAAGFEVHP